MTAEDHALDVSMGNKSGASFSVRCAQPVAHVERDGTVLRGRIPQWKRVLVKTTGVGGSVRLWILAPGPEANEIAFGEFYVRGRFAIADHSNNPRKVAELWKRTPPQ